MAQSDLPLLITSLPGPRAQAIIERDAQVLSPSYTRGYPLVVAHGNGAILEDVDGNRFLDFNAGIAVASTGHSHPDVVDAIQQQSAQFLHMSGTDFYYEGMVEFGEELTSVTPGCEGGTVYFGNSGTEAVEAAMKLARYRTGRKQFLSFFGSFHGRTMGSLSLTGSKAVQRDGFFPLVPGANHTHYPNCYRCQWAKQPDTCGLECFKHIKDVLFRHTLPPHEVAAIFIEPVQGEGGYVVPPARFMEELGQLAAQHEILIVADEVQSGMGRTGRLFASEYFAWQPDLFTLAKGIASGLPLSATIARPGLMTWPPGSHASTFGGNPVSLAAALATLRLVRSHLMQNAAAMGEYIMNRIREWPDRFPIVGDVRGLGLMIGIELVHDQQTRERAPELRNQLENLAFERGLLILGAGPNSIRLCPPLVINRDQADFAMDTLEQCLRILSLERSHSPSTSAAASTNFQVL